jgi:hypothetical protein
LRLDDKPDALYGAFRILRGQDGDKALELAEAGVLSGFSVAARARTRIIEGGVHRRYGGRLDGVALCRTGAYKGAEVLAIRAEFDDELDIDESDLIPELDPELALRLSGFVEIPDEVAPRSLRAFTDQPWVGSEGRWDTAEAYCSSSLVDNNPAGQPKTKSQCHFPYKEPGSGDINVNALRAIVGGRGAQASFPGAEAARARARTLLAQANRRQSAA